MPVERRNLAETEEVYEFGDKAQVLNNAVNATVLFLDLRGFTKTSEGQVSERDLTRELYVVFDAFVPHVRRFGGTIDKFLGDGIMITYGTVQGTPLDVLNAVRSAILCQSTIRRLREEGKTVFQKAGCTSCHTLADAGATGTVGPNLDQAKPPKALVADRVTNGKGVMPSFRGQLSETEIDAVATYVSTVAGK